MTEETTTETPVREPVTDAGKDSAKTDASVILDELKELGHKATAALQQVWDSEERKKAEEEIRKALKMAGERIDEVGEELRHSDTTKEIKDQASKLVESVEKSKISDDIRKGLLSGLRKLNTELTDFLDRDKSPVKKAGEAASEAAEKASEAAEKAGEAAEAVGEKVA